MANLRSFGGTTAAAVDAFERANGLTLPADYREFLTRHNGGFPDPAAACVIPKQGQSVIVQTLLGLGREREFDLQGWHDEYGDEMPPGSLIVAVGAGAMLFILVPGAADAGVYCWDHAHNFAGSSEEDGNTYFVAPTFAAFLASLVAVERAER